MDIKIRQATKKDSHLIAQVVAMAIGLDGAKDYAGEEAVKVLEEVAERENTQYSYRNALIGMADGKVAGAIIGYDGGLLDTLRKASLSVIHKYHPELKVTDNETGEGEFYLDSLGVLPEFRGHGIGRQLIGAMIERASSEDYERIGLLVDPDNPDAERLYRCMGFHEVGKTPFFGKMMTHLQLRCNQK